MIVLLVALVAFVLFVLVSVVVASVLLAGRIQSLSWGKMLVGGLSAMWVVPILLILAYVGFFGMMRSTPRSATIVMPQPVPPFPAPAVTVKVDDQLGVELLRQSIQKSHPEIAAALSDSASRSPAANVAVVQQAQANEPAPAASTSQPSPGLQAEAPIQEQTRSQTSETPAEPKKSTTDSLPDWVKDKELISDGKRLIVLTSQQYATPEEADVEIRHLAYAQVDQDLRRTYRYQGSPTIPQSSVESALRRRHVEQVTRRTGTGDNEFVVYRVYRQLELSPPLRDSLERLWRESNGERGLWRLGSLAAFVTLVFGTMFTYLRLDTRTGSAYRGRLRLAAVCLIAAGGVVAMSLIA
jgi:hypothetical protein